MVYRYTFLDFYFWFSRDFLEDSKDLDRKKRETMRTPPVIKYASCSYLVRPIYNKLYFKSGYFRFNQ